MWNGLLGVEFDVFYKYEYDKLATVTGAYAPSRGGYYFSSANVNKSDYKGFDLTLTHYNHINKFNKKFAYEYIPITPELVPECLQLECKWYKANREDNDEEDLNDERRSIIYALNHYDELGLIGGAICVDHQIVAFTFGAPINHNTFGVHVEKANVNYEGAYAVINKEFASHLPEKYTYVNREEDLGIPGLRQAKLSYNPFILLEKSAAIKKPAK